MNKLVHIDEFREILSAYQMSDETKKVLRRTPMVLLVGISSTGRNTLIRELVKTDKFHFVISDTTRLPRDNDGVHEQNGVEYWFRTEDHVLNDLKEGKFIEAAIIHNQQVSGVSVREVIEADKEHRTAVADVEPVGANNIVTACPEVTAIFVLPPSYEEWQRRLKHRGLMSDHERANRMESAQRELKEALERPFYRFVVNDDLERATKAIQAIVDGRSYPEAAARARSIAEDILHKLGSDR